MRVYYLNKHLMCEHYRNNSPTGFRVLKVQKGVTTHTDPSRTAMIFLLEGCMHVEGKQFPSFTVQTNQMFPMPAGINNSISFLEDSTLLVLYFIDSKFRFCRSILSDEKISNAPKRNDWLFALDMIKPVQVLARQTADYIVDKLLCCDIQLIKQREFTAVMQAYYPTDTLASFLAPLFRVNLSFQETIMGMAGTYPSVDEMAEKVCMSRPTFIRHFKACFGEPPKTWVNKVKGEALFKALRNTNDTLEEIANQFKFSSVQRMSTFCKETLEGTPNEIRSGKVIPKHAL